jgi:hypothetical protein
MKKVIFWLAFILLLTGLACNLPFGLGGGSEPEASLPGADAESFSAGIPDETLLEPTDLSGAQRQMLSVRGNPNRFVISFFDGMREETWYYDATGFAVTFRNGETYTESRSDPASEALTFKSIYFPWLFNGAMGLSELLAVSGSEAFTIESLDEVFGEAVSLVTLAGLDAGFRGGHLLFVRTVPLDGLQTEAAISDLPAEDGSLTAAEQRHVGSHTYQVFCSYSDGTTEDGEETIQWSFTRDGLYYDGEGPYPQTGDNFYGLSDETGEIYFYLQDNVITITGEFFESGTEGEKMPVSFVCVLTRK